MDIKERLKDFEDHIKSADEYGGEVLYNARKKIQQLEQKNERLEGLIKKALNEIPPNPKLALTIIIREILEKALEE